MVTWSSSSCSMRAMAVSWSSSAVRSCITRLARGGSFHRLGSSACLFSSASRRAPCRRQRCLLSSPTDCLISSTMVSISARMTEMLKSIVEWDVTRALAGAQWGGARQYRPPVPDRTARSASGDYAHLAASRLRPDDRIIVGRRGAGLEGFEDDARHRRAGAHAGLRIDADELDAGRHAERNGRLVGERHFQKSLTIGAARWPPVAPRPRWRGLS